MKSINAKDADKLNCVCGHPLHDSGSCPGKRTLLLPPENPEGSRMVRCYCHHSRLSGEAAAKEIHG